MSSAESANVIDLLTYIEEVEKLKRKPTYVLPTEFYVGHQGALKGLPDLQANLQHNDSEIWLSVPRLQEIAAPDTPSELTPWVSISKSTETTPSLKSTLPIFDGKNKVGEETLADNPEIEELFNWYVQYLWEPWSAAERLRRKTISLYNKLFLLQQSMASDAGENPIEFVWGIGVATWKRPGSASKVEHPLLTQLCDIRLNEKSFALEVCPREAEPKIELDCYVDMEIPGALALESLWKEMQSTLATSVSPFAPDTFNGILKSAVAQLDPSGRYEQRTDDLSIPTAAEHLVVTDTWVIFARKRSADVFLEDVRRLKKSIEDGAGVPNVIQEFVTEGDSEVRAQPEVPFRGLSTSVSGSGVKELFFPMPYNEEQVSIVRKLEANNGVVVQGPPGTGKTHTIANVICHYLAQGKRVLVTSKGETALSVLQEKLPERIRALSVALLSDDQNGMRQFEHSIQTIASEVGALQPERLEASIKAREAELDEIHARISSVDQAIAADAAQNMQKYQYQGQEVTPESLAKLVTEQQEDHQWFDDELPESSEPPFGNEEVRALREARVKASNDFGYIGVESPHFELLPTWEQLLPLHKDIVRARTIDAEVQSGNIHALKDSTFETFEEARNLLEILTGYLERYSMVIGKPNGKALRDKFRDTNPDDILVKGLSDLRGSFDALEEHRKKLIVHAIDLPTGAEKNIDFNEALERLIAGKSAFGLPFGKAEARKLIAATTIEGSPPTGAKHWNLIREAAHWRRSVARELARYSSIAGEFGLEAIHLSAPDLAARHCLEQLNFADAVKQMVLETENVLFARVSHVFGAKVAGSLGEQYESELPALIDSLHAHLDKGRLGHAMQKVASYMAILDGKGGEVTDKLRDFIHYRLGSPSEDEVSLRGDWIAITEEVKRVATLKPSLELIKECSDLVAKAGAPKWASRISNEPPTPDFDPIIPNSWEEAWAWRKAMSVLERIDVHSKIRARFQERRELTTRLSRTYQDLIADKTWLEVHRNSPPSIRQALQAYLTSIQAMGSGTGIRAIRHRRNARQAMEKAYRAVPCWVLPQWRVSETLPPELGLFDLVVVDEASQSDIWALPALMRGKKLLVVGDHKQVSPSVVGMPEQKIVDIQKRFLEAQPHGRHMTPDSSIYDLARVIFAGNSVMLKEHFRCVSAIIEYSNREFYEGAIRPLRVPNADERLDPPLVDVLVQGGYRKGDQNVPEAEAIVQEIESILQDVSMENRTIGVVTLLGTEQAKLISELVAERIAPEDVVSRKITIGPPPQFQGRERDIMLVSMVLQSGDKTAANSLGQQQRFNVALSRARDRTYLFRSVSHDSFPSESLTGRLMRHFRQPFALGQDLLKANRELCASGFELEMFDELTQRGYRVRPQVPCGGYRIDFVVEGAEGRRLAIECDGDRFHGPGQWADDMSRQRVLERAGWVFWRCFASSFVRRRKEVLDDLLATLDELGIEPMADGEADSGQWVHTKIVDPMGINTPVTAETVEGGAL